MLCVFAFNRRFWDKTIGVGSPVPVGSDERASRAIARERKADSLGRLRGKGLLHYAYDS